MANEGEKPSASWISAHFDNMHRKAAELDNVSFSSSASSIGNDGQKLPRCYKSVSKWTQPMVK